MSKYCEEKNIKLTFWIPPCSKELNTIVDDYNLTKERQQFYDDLKMLGEVYNFNLYEFVVNNKDNFTDPAHFNFEIGNYIYDVIFKSRKSNLKIEQMSLNKVLILTNPLNHEGGVVNYYNLFFKHFESDIIALKHGSIGSRTYLFYYPVLKRLLYPFYYLLDVLVYFFTLLFNRRIKIVQVSPSLIPVPLIRDGLLVLIAKLLGKKVVIFYRGWKLPTYHKIAQRDPLRKLFNFIFQKNTLQVVLASSFKNDLEKLNPKKKANIIVTTTAIDKSQIVKLEAHTETKPIKVLFLGRIQDLKGVGELVDAIGQLKQMEKLNEFKFSIVGHENKIGYTNELKKKLECYGVKSEKADFLGRISGQEKYQLYANHDIYVLPSYTEGCPNSLLEALASGLFCITTRVGALSDIISPKGNGLFVNTKDSEDLLSALLYCSSNKDFNKNRLANADKYSSEFDIKEITQFFENKYIDLIEHK